MFNMFQSTEQPMVTEHAEEGQGETSPGDTHDHVDQEAEQPDVLSLLDEFILDQETAEADSLSQETVCH